jgi:hypothetical protein
MVTKQKLVNNKKLNQVCFSKDNTPSQNNASINMDSTIVGSVNALSQGPYHS